MTEDVRPGAGEREREGDAAPPPRQQDGEGDAARASNMSHMASEAMFDRVRNNLVSLLQEGKAL